MCLQDSWGTPKCYFLEAHLCEQKLGEAKLTFEVSGGLGCLPLESKKGKCRKGKK